MFRVVLYVFLSLFSASAVFACLALQCPKSWGWAALNAAFMIMNACLAVHYLRALLKKRKLAHKIAGVKLRLAELKAKIWAAGARRDWSECNRLYGELDVIEDELDKIELEQARLR